MSIEVKMPALSPTMEKGTLAKWLVAEGDRVRPGDVIAEIETDKATMEYEAIDEGFVARLIMPEGADDVAVGTVIALLAESADAALLQSAKLPVSQPAAPVQVMLSEASPTTPPSGRLSPAHRVRASPLALRIAEAKGIDLSAIVGTGPNGRIVCADLGIKALVAPLPTVPAQLRSEPIVAPAIVPPLAGVPVESTKLSGMRRTIARRLTEAKQTIPHFCLTSRCNLDPLQKLRGELNGDLADRGVKLSVNDMLIKAMALALVEVPDANVQFGGEELYHFERVDIAMAVAIEGGLITPIIRDVAALSLSAIAAASKALATQARDGKLAPEAYQGGTASISNLGMFGIDEMVPVINPPQALILGIGAGVEQPWKVNGGIALATIMAATASFDHRAIDGAVAARFMAAFHNLVESPKRLLV